MPNMAERVLKYLEDRPGTVLCDECVARGVRTRHSLSRMLDVFNSHFFRRSVAPCDGCGQKKLTTVRYPLRH